MLYSRERASYTLWKGSCLPQEPIWVPLRSENPLPLPRIKSYYFVVQTVDGALSIYQTELASSEE